MPARHCTKGILRNRLLSRAAFASSSSSVSGSISRAGQRTCRAPAQAQHQAYLAGHLISSSKLEKVGSAVRQELANKSHMQDLFFFGFHFLIDQLDMLVGDLLHLIERSPLVIFAD